MEPDESDASPPKRPPSPPAPREIFVRADEIDEAGADISAISLADQRELQARVEARRALNLQRSPDEARPLANAADTAPASAASAGGDRGARSTGPAGAKAAPVRPILRREGSTNQPPPPPPPPRQPPPPAPLASAASGVNGGGSGGLGEGSAPPDGATRGHAPTDSLSLQQLRELVAQLPKAEPPAYAYAPADTRGLAEELEEWFQYTAAERGRLAGAKAAFGRRLAACAFEGGGPSAPESVPAPAPARRWLELPSAYQEAFVRDAVAAVRGADEGRAEGGSGGSGGSAEDVTAALESLAYVAMGAWGETAGAAAVPDPEEEEDFQPPDHKYLRALAQLRCIQGSAVLLCRLGAAEVTYEVFRHVASNDEQYRLQASDYEGQEQVKASYKEAHMSLSLSILYFLVECGRRQILKKEGDSIRRTFAEMKPDLLPFLSQLIASFRWEDGPEVPFTRILLLFWKAWLLLVGGSNELEESKTALRSTTEPDKDKGEAALTASPLDYHVFRQEITSKYPAFNPPPPLVPLELDNQTLLPPLPNDLSRSASHASLQGLAGGAAPGGAADGAGGGRSIFHQPVHIATPAPSPPPSPGGQGGKGTKKQNYQTNQHFPFLYPPLDGASNALGGKGPAEEQDRLVGKPWAGSDIPASILEAAQLFASRMRMSRPLRQLWEAREDFIKHDRGWEGETGRSNGVNGHAEDETEWGSSSPSANEDAEGEAEAENRDAAVNGKPSPSPSQEHETDDPKVQGRLDMVESFYVRSRCQSYGPLLTCVQRASLPHLQSIVIVLLKVMLSNLSAASSQSNEPKGPADALDNPSDHEEETCELAQNNLNLARNLSNLSVEAQQAGGVRDRPLQDLNAVRTREITSKAISGLLLMFLKWFRLSHILKFEYLNELLLDSNYVPLALKYFAQQDIDKAVEQKNDNPDLDFFRFCYLDAGNAPSPPRPRSPPRPLSPSSSSSDEAQPPPIRRNRSTPETDGTVSPSGEDPPPAEPTPAAEPPGPEGAASPSINPSPPLSPRASPPLPRSPAQPPPAAPPLGAAGASDRPEVDELGHPTHPPPVAPRTTYAPRFFATYAATLRVLQKLTKRHAHRSLLLVQYKAAAILRRGLRVPQPRLRLYTLKLVKSQVPYCGRKWRQANMRVITAIYVFCRMGLRDEWIAGGAPPEEWVEGALAVERAWRGLVGWWHARRYRASLGAAGGAALEAEESDFFARELERMGWGVGGLLDDGAELEGEGLEEDELAGAAAPTGEWVGGPLALEGW